MEPKTVDRRGDDHNSAAGGPGSGSNIGRSIAFVSPKGGTGKTLFSATMAYLLLKSGQRVVAIDGDFSTRGLSLYLLGEALRSSDLDVLPRNCLAEAVLQRLSFSDIEPRVINREGLQYHLIVSNVNLWRGGIPDHRFLSDLAGDANASVGFKQYFEVFRGLSDSLKSLYDYVIIDTRGGYDYTSAVPALVADGYVIVTEADSVSIEQINGFKESIGAFAKELKCHPLLRGFVINKATFPPDDTFFQEGLVRLYGGKSFGVVPVDYECTEAYQFKKIPAEVKPDSKFAFYSTRVIERIVGPEVNWPEDQRDHWAATARSITALWNGRQRWEALGRFLPVVQMLVLIGSLLSYLVFRVGGVALASFTFYGAMGVFILSSLGTIGVSLGQSVLPWRRRSATQRIGLLAAALVLAALTTAVFVDVPMVLSEKALFKRLENQNIEIRRLQSELATRREESNEVRARLEFLVEDLRRLQRQVDMSEETALSLEAALSDSVDALELLGARESDPRQVRDALAYSELNLKRTRAAARELAARLSELNRMSMLSVQESAPEQGLGSQVATDLIRNMPVEVVYSIDRRADGLLVSIMLRDAGALVETSTPESERLASERSGKIFYFDDRQQAAAAQIRRLLSPVADLQVVRGETESTGEPVRIWLTEGQSSGLPLQSGLEEWRGLEDKP